MNLKRFLCLGLLIAALLVTACSPQATPEPTATLAPTAKPLPPTDTPKPAATTEVLIPSIGVGDEVPMGFTEEGAPYHGSPDAPVTLTEYSDYQ